MQKNNSNKIGEKLRKAREYMELTQEQVASILSLGRDAILRIENGTRKISTDELLDFSELYAISADDLLRDNIEINYQNQAFARGMEKLSEHDKKEVLNLIKYKNEITKK